MSNLENELKDLRENNNELVQKVQYWKMTAAQRETENIELMKEVTELRLKLSRLRNGGDAQAHKLDAALQETSEVVLSHLVQASNAVARSMELVKTYMHEREELESSLPRWSTLSEGHSSKKINKVRPMLIGGRTVQPFVLLDRTIDGSNYTTDTSQNQSHNVSNRAIPMHMLLDVYIPLRRIDADNIPANNEDNNENVDHANDSTEGLGLEESEERISDDSRNVAEGEVFEESRRLDAVTEDVEPEEEEQTPQRPQADNPLEGPSWLLDRPNSKIKSKLQNLEPDSTTGMEGDASSSPGSRTDVRRDSQQPESARIPGQAGAGGSKVPPPAGGSKVPPPADGSKVPPPADGSKVPPPADGSKVPPPADGSKVPPPAGGSKVPPPAGGSSQAPPAAAAGYNVFSPTVRRRRRASPPPPATPRTPRADHYSPRPARRLSNSERVLKVLVPKMQLDEDDGSPRSPATGALRARPSLLLGPGPSPTLPVRGPGARAHPGPSPHKRCLLEPARPGESPPKRPTMRFDAPSPNGATDARVIVMESHSSPPEPCGSGGGEGRVRARGRRRLDSAESVASADSRGGDSRASDSEGEMLADRRPRRLKKTVVYKEKPLNRKMRR